MPDDVSCMQTLSTRYRQRNHHLVTTKVRSPLKKTFTENAYIAGFYYFEIVFYCKSKLPPCISVNSTSKHNKNNAVQVNLYI